MTDLFEKCSGDGGYFGKYRVRNDHYVVQPILDSLPGPNMVFNGKPVIMWGVNNYLGIAGNQKIKSAAIKSLNQYSTSTPMGSRLLTGTTTKHIELEKKLAAYCDKPASILFNYGYLGIIGSISALIGNKDEVIIDKLSHASMLDGTLLAMAGRKFRVFKHNNMKSLEQQLQTARLKNKAGILIVIEGVYGMRGDLANIPEIVPLAKKYDARILIDDAHGFGVMGPTGRGTPEHFNLSKEIDLYFGTFAKAFAAIGGVTAGPKKVIDYIRFNARTNVFAKALPTIYVDTIDETLNEIEEHPEYRDQLWNNAHQLQTGLQQLGYSIGDTQSPITPVYITGGPELAEKIMKTLRDEYGIFLSGVTYPVVPKGLNLFRMIPTAKHTQQDIDTTLAAFKAIKSELNLNFSQHTTKNQLNS